MVCLRNGFESHAPNKRAKIINLVRDTRGGKVYDSDFSQRMRGRGVYADLIRQRFNAARRRAGFTLNAASGFKQRTDLFERPLGTALQPSLFD